jgi:hypothetical protein
MDVDSQKNTRESSLVNFSIALGNLPFRALGTLLTELFGAAGGSSCAPNVVRHDAIVPNSQSNR